MGKQSSRLKLVGITSIGIVAVGVVSLMLMRPENEASKASAEPTETEEAKEPKSPAESDAKATGSSLVEAVDVPVLQPAEKDLEALGETAGLIDPAARQRAEFFIGMMEQAVESGMAERWMSENSPEARTGKLLDALTARLNLNDEQRLVLENILLENMKDRQDPFRRNPELMTTLLQDHRDLVVDGTALRIMGREGELTEAQEAYGQQIKSQFTNLLGFDPESHESVPRWLENEETLASMDANLVPEQQEELDVYIKETLVREREQTAFRKSNQLANQLGLSNEDRDSLYEFYYEKPEATNEDLKEVLDPSVHPMLENVRTGPFR